MLHFVQHDIELVVGLSAAKHRIPSFSEKYLDHAAALPRLIQHLDLAFLLENLPARQLARAPEAQAEPCAATAQPAQRQIGQPGWQRRGDIQLAMWGIGTQPKQRTDQMQDRAGRPSLRNIRAKILNWKAAALARQAGVQLGQAIAIEASDRLPDTTRQLAGLARKPVAPEARRDNPIIVRPDRAAVIAMRVVA